MGSIWISALSTVTAMTGLAHSPVKVVTETQSEKAADIRSLDSSHAQRGLEGIYNQRWLEHIAVACL